MTTPCAEMGPYLWFSDDHRERAQAVSLCLLACDAREWCHAEGEAVRACGHRLFGVWSGVDYGMKAGAPAYPGTRTADRTKCGTEAGATRHRRAGEPVCPACREGGAEARREREWRKANAAGRAA